MAENNKRGRRPTAPAEKVGPAFVGKTPPDLAEHEARHNQQLAVIGTLLPAGFVYDEDEMISKAERHLRIGAIEWLELGRALLIIKEHAPIGRFHQIVQDRLRLELRGAQRAMHASARYLGGTLDPSSTTTLSCLTQSKMLELLVLDDDELEALSDGGTVADLNLDKIDRMSVRELRAELRKAKAKTEKDGERAGNRENEISDLNAQLSEAKRQLRTVKPDAAGKQMLLELTGVILDARNAIGAIRAAVDQVLEHSSKHGLDYMADIAAHGTEVANLLIEVITDLRTIGIDAPAEHVRAVVGA